MGKLVPGDIKSLFNGVSRQPDIVRLPAQVEEADNVILSVVNGGPQRRPATRHVSLLTGLATGTTYFVHPIDRDTSEKYLVVLGNSSISIFNGLTGSTISVATPDGVSYLAVSDPIADFACVSVADYTFVVNRTQKVALKPNPAWSAIAGGTGTNIGDMTASGGLVAAFDANPVTVASEAASVDANVGKDYGAGTEKMVTRAVVSGIVGATSVQLQYSSDAVNYTTVQTATPVAGAVDMWDYEAPSTYRYWRLKFTVAIAATIDVAEVVFHSAVAINGTKGKFSDLAQPAVLNQIWKINGDATTLDDYYVMGRADGSWEEVANPASRSYFSEVTMPHILVRETNGTFTFKKADWDPRAVGNESLVPKPNFVARQIRDVFLHKNRFGFVADEYVFFSQAGDYFNLWPDKATEVLDGDPIDKAASTSKVTIFDWAVPFRSSLFVSAELAQFEVSQGTTSLTPKTAAIDLTTSYRASRTCRPVVMGDSLYFASTDGNNAIVFEYFYDDRTISNTAADVTKHAEGYVPTGLMQFVAEPTSGTLFSLTSGDPDAVYVYSVYWSGEEKAQSAWHRWTIAGATVRGMTILDNELFIVAARSDGVYLEKVRAYRAVTDPVLNFEVALDRRVTLTGVYDAMNNWTTWTTPYAHGSLTRLVRAGTWPVGERGAEITALTYPTTTTVRKAGGDFSAFAVFAGASFTSSVVLSKQYVRKEDGSAVITGRLQLKRMALSYRESGYFDVVITPSERAAYTYSFNARFLGEAQNVVGAIAISPRGTFKFPVMSRADTVKVEARSNSYLPFTIISGSWVGFFNDVGRNA